jgi:DNA-binding MarR family transcriptional regulator
MVRTTPRSSRGGPWFRRELDPGDRRSLPATLTDAGREIFLWIVAGQAERERDLFTALPGAEVENLRDLLRQVMEVLSGELGPAHRRTRLALDGKG